MKTILYKHLVHYYETDKMGCVHHSNYIRWFEEARTRWLEENGFGYTKMEALGIMTPVLSAEAKYISMTRFNDTVDIEVSIDTYTGSKVSFVYKITDENTQEVRCTGKTSHCFLNESGRPVSLKKAIPVLHELCASMKI